MKVAVMQPYLFPSPSYYQLASSVDEFVLYDDVNYISRGYINRNTLLCRGEVIRFTVPVPGASINKKIKDLSFSEDTRVVRERIRHAYCKAPFFSVVYPLLVEVLTAPDRRVAEVCRDSLYAIFSYLGVAVGRIHLSSEMKYDRSLAAADRLIDICKSMRAEYYVNSIGGLDMYKKDYFDGRGVRLSFLCSCAAPFENGEYRFLPTFSIIDCLMWCPPDTIRSKLRDYELV